MGACLGPASDHAGACCHSVHHVELSPVNHFELRSFENGRGSSSGGSSGSRFEGRLGRGGLRLGGGPCAGWRHRPRRSFSDALSYRNSAFVARVLHFFEVFQVDAVVIPAR